MHDFAEWEEVLETSPESGFCLSIGCDASECFAVLVDGVEGAESSCGDCEEGELVELGGFVPAGNEGLLRDCPCEWIDDGGGAPEGSLFTHCGDSGIESSDGAEVLVSKCGVPSEDMGFAIGVGDCSCDEGIAVEIHEGL